MGSTRTSELLLAIRCEMSDNLLCHYDLLSVGVRHQPNICLYWLLSKAIDAKPDKVLQKTFKIYEKYAIIM